jgi:phospholipid/cholesterol/gamma-HCH transport system ATP-binding protein
VSDVIDARELAIGWGDRAVLEDLTFSVPSGSLFAILGRSGSGKSTLFRHLVGLEAPMSGTLLVNGRPPHLGAARPTFGVSFQSGALFGSMTLAENVALPLQKWTDLDPYAVEAIVEAKLAVVGLAGFEDHLPSEVSGGMAKRAAIARAIALDADLLFFDEPSAGLDPVSSAGIDELLLTLNRSLGTTIIFVTHEMASVYRIATSCLLVDGETRRIIARGDPRELRDRSSDPRVQCFFRREAGEMKP